jgi:hypothetical protein
MLHKTGSMQAAVMHPLFFAPVPILGGALKYKLLSCLTTQYIYGGLIIL